MRPVVSVLACVMSTTAAVQFGCVVLFVWMMAQVVRTSFDPFDTVEGVFLHMAERFHLKLIGGLAWPLLGIPTVTVVAGFLLLLPRDWTRICYSVLGVGALAWSAFWLRDDLRWWIAPAIYIAFCTCIVWTRGATRWYGDGSRRARARRLASPARMSP